MKNPNVDPNCTDSSGMTPLYRACRYSQIYSTYTYMYMYDVSLCKCIYIVNFLHSCGHKDITESLLKGSNIDPNCSEANGWTPLHWACEYVVNRLYVWIYTEVNIMYLNWCIIQVGLSGYREDPD